MADPNPHEIAAELILDQVRNIKPSLAGLYLQDYDLTRAEYNALVAEIGEMVATATLTVSFPNIEQETT